MPDIQTVLRTEIREVLLEDHLEFKNFIHFNRFMTDLEIEELSNAENIYTE